MSQMYKLSEVEAFRAQVLLEEALKKLLFLNSISTTSSVHGDELTQFTGDEISRIIQEQRDLEKKYEELIAERSRLKGLCNKNKYLELQQQIQDVAHRLKESNKSLCRNLKENPDVAGNLEKMKQEQRQVQEWLEETNTDLLEFSFANLVAKVEAEKREQERLTEVKRKTEATTAEVRRLEDELRREQQDNERESKQTMQEIKELKEELKKSQTISDIEFKFEEQKLRAREQDLLRTQSQREKRLQEDHEELLAAQRMERATHDRAAGFLEDKLGKLQKDKEVWTNDIEKELRDRDDELGVIKQNRQNVADDLGTREEQRKTEETSQREKEEEMRNEVLIRKQRAEQLQRMEVAVFFLQEEGRKYMERIQLRNANKKGKKKKGKKK